MYTEMEMERTYGYAHATKFALFLASQLTGNTEKDGKAHTMTTRGQRRQQTLVLVGCSGGERLVVC